MFTFHKVAAYGKATRGKNSSCIRITNIGDCPIHFVDYNLLGDGFKKITAMILIQRGGFVFVEDGVQIGGISEYLNSFLLENNFTNTKILAFEDKFYEHGSRFDVCKCANLTSQDIASAIKELSAK